MACKKKHPTPEVLDPIYNDLVKQAGFFKGKVEQEKKQIKKLEKTLAETEARTIERVATAKDIRFAKKRLEKYVQDAKFYEIRSEHRKAQSRYEYNLAFSQDKDWPDPEEYKKYLVNKKLREAPRNWGYRVPKLHKNNPNYEDAQKSKPE